MMPFQRIRMLLIAPVIFGAACIVATCCSRADEQGQPSVERPDAGDEKANVARQRLEIMTAHIKSIVISSTDATIPKQMQPTPLFRYDDQTRGYVDGTVWRLPWHFGLRRSDRHGKLWRAGRSTSFRMGMTGRLGVGECPGAVVD